MKFVKLVLVTVILLLLLAGLGIGCARSAPASRPAATPSAPKLDVSASADPDTGQCHVVVVVRNPGSRMNLDVTIQAEPGIIFTATGTSQSETQKVKMMAMDRRDLAFECRLDHGQARLSGAYVVRARAHFKDSDQLFQEGATHLYVHAPEGEAPRFLASQTEFDNYFTEDYTEGTDNLSYRMVFDPGGQMTTGKVHVRVTGRQEGAPPIMQINSAEGVYFTTPVSGEVVQVRDEYAVEARLPALATGGIRIVTFPFIVEEGCVPGRYTLHVWESAGLHEVAEIMPLAIEVLEEADESDTPQVMIHTIAAHKLDGDAAGPRQSGAEEVVPPPTPLPPAGDNPEVNAGASDGQWQHSVRGFSGNRWDFYSRYVVDQSSMSWAEFRREVVEKNPQLIADEYMFRSDKTYLMPVPGGALANSQP